ncbi:MAG: hypothetical protein ACRDKZ_13365 [Actinomycetota bacterium]
MDTFVVQVWVPSDANTPDARLMRGQVRHVRSGASTPFVGAGELLEFIGELGRRDASKGAGPNNNHARGEPVRSGGPLPLQEWLSFGS